MGCGESKVKGSEAAGTSQATGKVTMSPITPNPSATREDALINKSAKKEDFLSVITSGDTSALDQRKAATRVPIQQRSADRLKVVEFSIAVSQGCAACEPVLQQQQQPCIAVLGKHSREKLAYMELLSTEGEFGDSSEKLLIDPFFITAGDSGVLIAHITTGDDVVAEYPKSSSAEKLLQAAVSTNIILQRSSQAVVRIAHVVPLCGEPSLSDDALRIHGLSIIHANTPQASAVDFSSESIMCQQVIAVQPRSTADSRSIALIQSISRGLTSITTRLVQPLGPLSQGVKTNADHKIRSMTAKNNAAISGDAAVFSSDCRVMPLLTELAAGSASSATERAEYKRIMMSSIIQLSSAAAATSKTGEPLIIVAPLPGSLQDDVRSAFYAAADEIGLYFSNLHAPSASSCSTHDRSEENGYVDDAVKLVRSWTILEKLHLLPSSSAGQGSSSVVSSNSSLSTFIPITVTPATSRLTAAAHLIKRVCAANAAMWQEAIQLDWTACDDSSNTSTSGNLQDTDSTINPKRASSRNGSVGGGQLPSDVQRIVARSASLTMLRQELLARVKLDIAADSSTSGAAWKDVTDVAHLIEEQLKKQFLPFAPSSASSPTAERIVKEAATINRWSYVADELMFGPLASTSPHHRDISKTIEGYIAAHCTSRRSALSLPSVFDGRAASATVQAVKQLSIQVESLGAVQQLLWKGQLIEDLSSLRQLMRRHVETFVEQRWLAAAAALRSDAVFVPQSQEASSLISMSSFTLDESNDYHQKTTKMRIASISEENQAVQFQCDDATQLLDFILDDDVGKIVRISDDDSLPALAERYYTSQVLAFASNSLTAGRIRRGPRSLNAYARYLRLKFVRTNLLRDTILSTAQKKDKMADLCSHLTRHAGEVKHAAAILFAELVADLKQALDDGSWKKATSSQASPVPWETAKTLSLVVNDEDEDLRVDDSLERILGLVEQTIADLLQTSTTCERAVQNFASFQRLTLNSSQLLGQSKTGNIDDSVLPPKVALRIQRFANKEKTARIEFENMLIAFAGTTSPTSSTDASLRADNDDMHKLSEGLSLLAARLQSLQLLQTVRDDQVRREEEKQVQQLALDAGQLFESLGHVIARGLPDIAKSPSSASSSSTLGSSSRGLSDDEQKSLEISVRIHIELALPLTTTTSPLAAFVLQKAITASEDARRTFREPRRILDDYINTILAYFAATNPLALARQCFPRFHRLSSIVGTLCTVFRSQSSGLCSLPPLMLALDRQLQNVKLTITRCVESYLLSRRVSKALELVLPQAILSEGEDELSRRVLILAGEALQSLRQALASIDVARLQPESLPSRELLEEAQQLHKTLLEDSSSSLDEAVLIARRQVCHNVLKDMKLVREEAAACSERLVSMLTSDEQLGDAVAAHHFELLALLDAIITALNRQHDDKEKSQSCTIGRLIEMRLLESLKAIEMMPSTTPAAPAEACELVVRQLEHLAARADVIQRDISTGSSVTTDGSLLIEPLAGEKLRSSMIQRQEEAEQLLVQAASTQNVLPIAERLRNVVKSVRSSCGLRFDDAVLANVEAGRDNLEKNARIYLGRDALALAAVLAQQSQNQLLINQVADRVRELSRQEEISACDDVSILAGKYESLSFPTTAAQQALGLDMTVVAKNAVAAIQSRCLVLHDQRLDQLSGIVADFLALPTPATLQKTPLSTIVDQGQAKIATAHHLFQDVQCIRNKKILISMKVSSAEEKGDEMMASLWRPLVSSFDGLQVRLNDMKKGSNNMQQPFDQLVLDGHCSHVLSLLKCEPSVLTDLQVPIKLIKEKALSLATDIQQELLNPVGFAASLDGIRPPAQPTEELVARIISLLQKGCLLRCVLLGQIASRIGGGSNSGPSNEGFSLDHLKVLRQEICEVWPKLPATTGPHALVSAINQRLDLLRMTRSRSSVLGEGEAAEAGLRAVVVACNEALLTLQASARRATEVHLAANNGRDVLAFFTECQQISSDDVKSGIKSAISTFLEDKSDRLLNGNADGLSDGPPLTSEQLLFTSHFPQFFGVLTRRAPQRPANQNEFLQPSTRVGEAWNRAMAALLTSSSSPSSRCQAVRAVASVRHLLKTDDGATIVGSKPFLVPEEFDDDQCEALRFAVEYALAQSGKEEGRLVRMSGGSGMTTTALAAAVAIGTSSNHQPDGCVIVVSPTIGASSHARRRMADLFNDPRLVANIRCTSAAQLIAEGDASKGAMLIFDDVVLEGIASQIGVLSKASASIFFTKSNLPTIPLSLRARDASTIFQTETFALPAPVLKDLDLAITPDNFLDVIGTRVKEYLDNRCPVLIVCIDQPAVDALVAYLKASGYNPNIIHHQHRQGEGGTKTMEEAEVERSIAANRMSSEKRISVIAKNDLRTISSSSSSGCGNLPLHVVAGFVPSSWIEMLDLMSFARLRQPNLRSSPSVYQRVERGFEVQYGSLRLIFPASEIGSDMATDQEQYVSDVFSKIDRGFPMLEPLRALWPCAVQIDEGV